MWDTFLVLGIVACVIVGVLVIGKDNEFWDDEE